MSTAKTITVKKATLWSVGVRIWYVLQDTDGAIYQRWSNDGDTTDQVLMLTKVDDVLNIEYGEGPAYSMVNVSETPAVSPLNGDPATKPVEPTNIILSATFA